MFKVESSAEAREMGQWDITHSETGEVVARITTFHGFRKEIKQLKVKDKVVCEIKNQKQAVEKLEEFFLSVKKDILLLKSKVKEIESDLTLVQNDSSIAPLKREIENLTGKIEKLEQYNLI